MKMRTVPKLNFFVLGTLLVGLNSNAEITDSTKKFQIKSRMTEAKMNLTMIHALQEGYYLEKNVYISFGPLGLGKDCSKPNDLGFELENCAKSHYQYEVVVAKDGKSYTGTAKSGKGTANTVADACDFEDIWSINQNKNITHVQDAIAKCN